MKTSEITTVGAQTRNHDREVVISKFARRWSCFRWFARQPAKHFGCKSPCQGRAGHPTRCSSYHKSPSQKKTSPPSKNTSPPPKHAHPPPKNTSPPQKKHQRTSISMKKKNNEALGNKHIDEKRRNEALATKHLNGKHVTRHWRTSISTKKKNATRRR